MDRISLITQKEQTDFEKKVLYGMEIQKSTSKTTTVIIRVPNADRPKVKKDLELKLIGAKYLVMSKTGGGGTGTTVVVFSKHNIDILYKPQSGGMSETTLNSTITELSPAIAFMGNKTFTDVNKFYNYLKKTTISPGKIYVSETDRKSGIEFINTYRNSSKFEEKMKNAIQVGKFLKEKNEEKPINNVFWGYRGKPNGIPSNHKGDIFLKFNDGGWLGVSLKAGDEGTSEPQLNTYVQPMLKAMGYTITAIEKKVYDEVHSKLGLSKDWKDRANYKEAREMLWSLSQGALPQHKQYETAYDKMLELVRNHLVEQVGKDKKKAIEFIKKSILAEYEKVPLVVVKAMENKWAYLTDEDDIEKFLPIVSRVTAEISTTSKQNWFIVLHTKNHRKLTLKMSVRSNKSEPDNKLQQGFNLAVKFNGTE